MIDRGLQPGFSSQALAELRHVEAAPPRTGSGGRDLRDLLWCSIDNDDSRDLDQLTVCEILPKGTVKILVAIADVDSVVKKGSAIDAHAGQNTTSVYTVAEIFPMLPTELSTDVTSLNYGRDRLAMVVEMVVDGQGIVQDSGVYQATVRNKAKLAYNSVAAWLDDAGPMPAAVAEVDGMDAQIKNQVAVAQQLRKSRYEHGALDLETIEARGVFDGDELSDLREETKNRATHMIEDFMIAANGVTARFLDSRKHPSIRRVVRSPERWDRLVKLAAEYGERLPADPDSKALQEFLLKRKAADPLRFPDLSLTVIKLMGRGEYVVEHPGETVAGHFGLSVKDYTHSTAPNRRYADLVTQRLLKSAIDGNGVPYQYSELSTIARQCTAKEDDANKVERLVRKAAAALLLQTRVGQRFDAIVTGASDKGTWARIFSPPVEGRIVEGEEGLDVGDRIRVRLLNVDPQRGFIDFARV